LKQYRTSTATFNIRTSQSIYISPHRCYLSPADRR